MSVAIPRGLFAKSTVYSLSLGSRLNDICVELHLAGNAHIDIFVTNGNNQATNNAGIHTGGDLQ